MSPLRSQRIAYNDEMKILLIEDDCEEAEYMQKAFSEAGYTACIMNDSDLGFVLAYAAGYDVFVVDLMLPRRDGFSVIAGLRSLGNTIPVLIL